MTNPLDGKCIVFIRTSSTARIAPYRKIKSCGVKMVMVHPFANSAFDGLFDLWVMVETTDVDEIWAALEPKLLEAGLVPDAICSFDEYGVYPAAKLSERLGKRPTPFASEHVRNTNVKSTFRQFCKQNNKLTSPRSTSVYEGDENFEKAINTAGLVFPVVMKPSPGAGSLMAKLCADLDEVKEHGAKMWNTVRGHKDAKHFQALGTTQHIMIEEYIGGQEVDVDCCIQNGVIKFAAVSDNFPILPPYFVEVGGLCPSELQPSQQESCLQLLREFVAAYGDQITGVLHFEAKYDFDRKAAYVIEVNCRMGSAETYTMVKNAFNVDLAECFARCVVGAPVDDVIKANHANGGKHSMYCASVNIYPDQCGVLKRAEIVKDANFLDGLVGSEVGVFVAPPPRVFYMLCWMAARGDTPEDAKANIQRLTANFIQEVEKENENEA